MPPLTCPDGQCDGNLSIWEYGGDTYKKCLSCGYKHKITNDDE